MVTTQALIILQEFKSKVLLLYLVWRTMSLRAKMFSL